MPDFPVIEAKVPVRAARLERIEEPRSASLRGWLSGPVFTRVRDIVAANMTELLDRAEDPSRMIRMIILEMEETLVELRSTAARSIADVKELRASLARLEDKENGWTEKAELALSKDRDDLAKAALAERQKAVEIAQSVREEIRQIEQVLKGYEADIQRLQAKLAEARTRQAAIAGRIESAISRARAAELLNGGRTAEAFASFDRLERDADFVEARAEALGMGRLSIEEERKQRLASEKIDAELAAMKAAMAAGKQ